MSGRSKALALVAPGASLTASSTAPRVASLAAARVAALAAALVIAGCATPALDHGAYEQNAKSALESASSETASAALAVRLRLSDRATNPYTDTLVTASEKAMGGIETSFGGVDPPSPAEDDLRDSVEKSLGDAQDALSAARIAVRRDDQGTMRDAVKNLDAVTKALEDSRGKLG